MCELSMDFYPVLFNPRVSKPEQSQVKNKDVVVSCSGNGQFVAPRVPANLVALHFDDDGHLLYFALIHFVTWDHSPQFFFHWIVRISLRWTLIDLVFYEQKLQMLG